MQQRSGRGFAATCALALTLLLASVSPAAAATVITLTAQGVVAMGDDYRGDLTGVAGASLAGKSVTLVQTLEVTGGTDLSQAHNADASFAFFDKVSTAFSIDGGPVVSLHSALAALSAGLYAVSTLDGSLPRPASVDSQQSWLLLDGDTLQTQILASSALDDFIATAALFQNFSFSSPPPDGLMQMGADLSTSDAFGNSVSAWNFFVERLGSLDVVVTRDALLPAPTPLALLAVGLVLLAPLRRRAA